MKNRAIIIFLTAWIISNLGHSKTLVEFIIEAQSDYLVADTKRAVNADYYYSQAMRRATRFCHQALGTRAKSKLVKNWTSLQAGVGEEKLLIHNSSIICRRRLDLNQEHSNMGTYLEHARWVLEAFWGQKVEDQQVVGNIIKL